MKNVNVCEVKKIRYKKRNVRIISFLKKRSFTSFKENRKRVIKMARLGGGGNAYIQCFWCREKFLLVKLVADSLL